MCSIESYVFFDIETTGLPWQEKNQTKITELSFVATLRKDLSQHGTFPPLSKLTLVFNPGRPINTEVVKINGLSNDLLRNAPLFMQKIDTIVSFLKELPKPVCLVAHNGNRFDFKILLAEFCDAGVFLPTDLLCVDSLVGFQRILAKTNYKKIYANIPLQPDSVVAEDLLTDDEDTWPNLNLSNEEWKDINELCDSMSDISCEDINETKSSVKKQNGKKQANRSKVIEKVFSNTTNFNRESYTLVSIYRRLLNKYPYNHHRAEHDCCMLLECVLAVKDAFLPWADGACKKLTEIEPLIRH